MQCSFESEQRHLVERAEKAVKDLRHSGRCKKLLVAFCV